MLINDILAIFIGFASDSKEDSRFIFAFFANGFYHNDNNPNKKRL